MVDVDEYLNKLKNNDSDVLKTDASVQDHELTERSGEFYENSEYESSSNFDRQHKEKSQLILDGKKGGSKAGGVKNK